MTWSRRLLALAGIAYVFTGLTFLILPDYGAANFPWNVSEFVTMTIGGWTLGLGLMALDSIRGWNPAHTYPSLIAVWLFSALELVVVLAFVGLLRTDHLLTWPYLIAIVLGTASGIAGLPALWRMRAELAADVEEVPRWIRGIYVAFVFVTGLLAVITLFVTPTNGAFFPEPLSAFTARAFSAFFASLAFGALPLLFTRDVEPAVRYARAGLYPVFLILAAAVSYIAVFDFQLRPGGMIYIGAYVVTGIAALAIVGWHRRTTPDFTYR
jgi:hypothetical protein